MESMLSCAGVSKTFVQPLVPLQLLQDRLLQSRNEQHWRVDAVSDVTLSVTKGEWLGLYGPNGCGKTTLLRMLGGLMVPDTGTIDRSGRLLSFFDLSPGFHDEWDAAQNIYFFGLLQGLPPAEIRKMTDSIIAFAGLNDHRMLPFKCYSLGMRLRLGFAVVAHLDADVYLFDEVLAVGDRAFQDQCNAHLRRMKDAGKSVVLVSHSEDGLRLLCDRIIYMQKGRIVGERGVAPSNPI